MSGYQPVLAALVLHRLVLAMVIYLAAHQLICHRWLPQRRSPV